MESDIFETLKRQSKELREADQKLEQAEKQLAMWKKRAQELADHFAVRDYRDKGWKNWRDPGTG